MMTWWVDQTGQAARRAPRFTGKASGIYFDPDKFDRALQEQGDLLRWEQAARCPCSNNDQTGHGLVDCPLCYGGGWEYHSPLEIRGIVDRLELRLDALERLGDWGFGSASITLQAVHRPNFRDRFVMLENVVTHSEVVTRGVEGTADRLAFPIAKATERVLVNNDDGEEVVRNITYGVLRVRMMDPSTRRPAQLLSEGLDFDVTANGRIAWSLGDRRGTAPPPAPREHAAGGRYAITYYHRPSYIVQNWPFSMRTLHVKRKRPEAEHVSGPVSCFALMEARSDNRPAAEVPGGS